MNTNDSIKDIEAARKEIVLQTKSKRNVGGKLDPCPVCHKSVMHYFVAGNGHIRARCDNRECVRWIE